MSSVADARRRADADLVALRAEVAALAANLLPPEAVAEAAGYRQGFAEGWVAAMREAAREATARTRIWECPGCGRREYREGPVQGRQDPGARAAA